MPLAQGQILQNRYRIVRMLGQGGMAAVYLAQDMPQGNRWVAIKEMSPDPKASAHALAQVRLQFRREAQVVMSSRHHNLPLVYENFAVGGNEYLVMQYIEGRNLLDIAAADWQQGRTIGESRVLGWAMQIMDALEYLHSQRPYPVLHRDVKPQNIILTPGGELYLVDFGLVKLLDPNNPQTMTALRGLGTPEYAPPEQYASGGTHTGPHSDIYALGATLYHLLTRQPPSTATDRLLPVPMTRPLVPPRQLNPAISLPVEQALVKALELAPADRFTSVAEMRWALLGQGTVGPAKPLPRRRAVPVGRATRIGLISLLVIAVLILVAVLAGGPGPGQGMPFPTFIAWVISTPVPPTATLPLPTSTPVPPTSTPMPPTSTPVSPTVTPVVPTPTPVVVVAVVAPTHEETMATLGPTATPVPPTPTPPVVPTPTMAVALAGKLAYTVYNLDLKYLETIVVTVDGKPVLSVPSAIHPAFSPDGKWLAFRSLDPGGIGVMNLETRARQTLTGIVQDNHPSFNPGSRDIVFSRDDHLYLVDVVSRPTVREVGNLALMHVGIAAGRFPDWCRAAQQTPGIVYSGFAGGGRFGLMLTTPTYDVHYTITEEPNDFMPVWSPDCTQIAFAREDGGNWDIYLIKPDGSGRNRLTSEGTMEFAPVWSPAGDSIAFLSNRNGHWAIWVMDSNGRNPRELIKIEDRIHTFQNPLEHCIDWVP